MEQAIPLSLSPLNIIWGFQDDQNTVLNSIVLIGKAYINISEKLVLSSFILFYFLSENKWENLTIAKTWDTELWLFYDI